MDVVTKRSGGVGLDHQHPLPALAVPQLAPKRPLCGWGDLGGYSLEDRAWPHPSSHCSTQEGASQPRCAVRKCW